MHADGHGLYLHVVSPTSKSWTFRYMKDKKARTMGLGPANIVDLTTARQRVAELRRLLYENIDPLDHRDAEIRGRETSAKAAAEAEALRLRNEKSFDQCVEEYLAIHNATWKNEKHRDQWRNTLHGYASPAFGSMPVEKITTKHVQDALESLWSSRHETAVRTLQRITRVLIWAGAKGYREIVDSGFRATVTAGLGPQNRIVEHMAACHYTEVHEIIRRVHDSTSMPMLKRAFEFTVLTAARSGETRGAQWSEFDLEKKVWSIPGERMKAGRPHDVPLCERAVTLLKLSAPLEKKPQGLVFPGRKGQPLSDMAFTVLLRRQLGLICTMHGFRSTFRVWAAEQTVYVPEVCEAALAHARGNKVERTYNRTTLLEKRVPLMRDWAAYIEKPVSAQ
jgi:integrase